jgi:hypothetical protein
MTSDQNPYRTPNDESAVVEPSKLRSWSGISVAVAMLISINWVLILATQAPLRRFLEDFGVEESWLTSLMIEPWFSWVVLSCLMAFVLKEIIVHPRRSQTANLAFLFMGGGLLVAYFLGMLFPLFSLISSLAGPP